MARTRQEIKLEMTQNFMGNAILAELYGFELNDAFTDHFSVVSLENILFEIVAYALFLHEQIFDTHKAEVDDALFNQKNARPAWYRTMVLAFQYGFDLVPDTDNYNNSNATNEEVENSKIIKYAAVNESEDETRMIIKIAGETDGVLSPIEEQQQNALRAYVKEIRPACIKFTIINYLPNKLFLNLKIYRDPLVLDTNGMSILNGNYPVNDAINEFMKELPFDGEFIIQSFVDKLQQVTGVNIVHVNNIETSWIDPNVGDYGNPIAIYVKHIPESGYFTVENFENISYVV